MRIDELLDRCGETPGGCWEFGGAKSDKGYAIVNVGGRLEKGHRVTYEHFRAEIPDRLVMDHLCLHKSCVNPWHVEPVTNEVNLARWRAGITHCPAGHAYTEANRRGACRTCSRERRRETKGKGLTWAGARTHCPSGHAYDEANTYVHTDKRGHRRRICRECGAIRSRLARQG